VAGAIGPLLGGLFTQLLSWRWCFYINCEQCCLCTRLCATLTIHLVPCSALSFFVILFSLDLKVPETPLVAGLKAIDWLGGITITGATLMLLLSLEFGGVIFPWTSPKVICVIIFGLVTGALFFLNEAKLARYPIMPLRLFEHRSNIAALLVCFVHGFASASLLHRRYRTY
jgi:MFS family permease